MAVVDRGPAERCHLQAAAALPQALPPDVQAMAQHTGPTHTGTPAQNAISAQKPSMMRRSPKAPRVLSGVQAAAVFHVASAASSSMCIGLEGCQPAHSPPSLSPHAVPVTAAMTSHKTCLRAAVMPVLQELAPSHA